MGYVRIQVEGYFIERFINLCVSKKILLWNSKRKKSTLLFTNISIKEFREITKIAKQTKCRVKIKQKRDCLSYLINIKKEKFSFYFYA